MDTRTASARRAQGMIPTQKHGEHSTRKLSIDYRYMFNMYRMHFICTSAAVSVPASGRSRASRCGAQGDRPYPTRTLGPWPGSVSGALDVQSRGEVRSEIRRARPKPVQGTQKRILLEYFIYCLTVLSQQPSTARRPRYNSSRASRVSRCDSHERRFCVCACACLCARVCIIL